MPVSVADLEIACVGASCTDETRARRLANLLSSKFYRIVEWCRGTDEPDCSVVYTEQAALQGCIDQVVGGSCHHGGLPDQPFREHGMLGDDAIRGELQIKPRMKHLQVFGSEGYAHMDSTKRTKLELKSFRCMFLGYVNNAKEYRIYDLKASKVKVSRSVKMDEREMSETYDKRSPQQETTIQVTQNGDEPVALTRVKRCQTSLPNINFWAFGPFSSRRKDG